MPRAGKGRFTTLVMIAAAVAGCASPPQVAPAPDTGGGAGGAVASSRTHDGGVLVQVREYSNAGQIGVVAWDVRQPDFGLRASFTRNGALVRDHLLYISTVYPPLGRSEGRPIIPARYIQAVSPAGRALKPVGIVSDTHACQGGTVCSPKESFAARVPDAMLRANRDSISIRLPGQGGTDHILTVRRNIIDPYLATVDSLRGALGAR